MKTTLLRPPRLSQPLISHAPPQFPSVELMGGMYWNSSQGELLKSHLHREGKIALITPTTAENAFDGNVTLADFIEQKVKKINDRRKDVILIPHSYALHAAIPIAKQTPFVRGIIALAPGAHRGIHVPLNPRLGTLSMIMALLKKTSEIPDEHYDYVVDGAECSLGSANQKNLWRSILPKYFGYRTPMMESLSCKTCMIIFKDDKIVPFDVSIKIAEEHRPNMLIHLDGGHFAHTDPRYVHEVTEVVAGVIRSWVTVPNHN